MLGVIEMLRYLQTSDALLRERDAARSRHGPPRNSGEPLLSWTARSDPEELPATIALDEMLRCHEYERQRLGQELHDSAGQLLVALQLKVAHLRIVEENSDHDSLLQDINDTVRQIDQQIRSLAFLHFPAELADRGLYSAVQALALGFGRRTGIRTSFKSIGDQAAVDEPISVAILRVAQEALVNVHRHSHASSAKVVLQRRPRELQLTVSDDGIGIAAAGGKTNTRGIGLQGMRYRVEKLGGHFEIRNLKHGTKVSASVPLAA
jgi:signal transduction histidine kinase